MTIFVAGIVTVMVIAITQNQINAAPGIVTDLDSQDYSPPLGTYGDASTGSVNSGIPTDSAGDATGASSILPTQPTNLAGVSDIGIIIQRIIEVLFYGSQIIFIIILLYGGIRYLTSMGEEAAMTSARKTIFAALIGIVVVFSVWAIAQFVINALT